VKHHPAVADAWLLPVAAETWDGYLNDINGGHVTVEVAVRALESASTGSVEEGSVGGGTGMNCYAYKGGSGTASRMLAYGDERHVVGVFVQTNFGVRRELYDRRRADGRGARGRRPDRRALLGASGRRLRHRGGRDRCAAAAGPV
jgi:L-aminopeptidase/D-esterase-like protein